MTWRIANLTQSWHVHDHAQDHVLEGLDAERGVGLDGVGQRQVEEVHRPTLPDVAQALVPYSQVLPTIRGKTILSDTVLLQSKRSIAMEYGVHYYSSYLKYHFA